MIIVQIVIIPSKFDKYHFETYLQSILYIAMIWHEKFSGDLPTCYSPLKTWPHNYSLSTMQIIHEARGEAKKLTN
jgi:hypothetical protein